MSPLLPSAIGTGDLQRLADLLHGRLDEQRRRQDALHASIEDQAASIRELRHTVQRQGDKLVHAEAALRDARDRIRFLNEVCKVLSARLADSEATGDQP